MAARLTSPTAHERNSLAESLALLPASERQKFLASLTDRDAKVLLWDWRFWARQNQYAPPGDWQLWLLMAGRGFGKTRTGAEWVRSRVESGIARHIALISDTAADVRDVMVLGESGLLAICPPWNRPEYKPSYRLVVWPNGVRATLYSADDPEQLRGPQHDTAWVEELGKWRHSTEAFDNLLLGLRMGDNPRGVITTTPRPIRAIKALLNDPTCVVTTGSTYENIANLAPQFVQRIIQRYEGTRLGQQELYARILDDVPGALWKRDTLEKSRVTDRPSLTRIVVAIDPPAGSDDRDEQMSPHAEAGIIVAGLSLDGHGYVLDDRSLYGSPAEWGRAAVTAFNTWRADRIIGEVNNGGQMVGYVIWSIGPNVPYKAVHASRGKFARAEPIAALYEQGRIHHVGIFPDLEDQLCTWVPGAERSPDRLDALVWALSELFVEPEEIDEIIVHDDHISISPF